LLTAPCRAAQFNAEYVLVWFAKAIRGRAKSAVAQGRGGIRELAMTFLLQNDDGAAIR
jgi:hypothetical protein